MNFYLIFVEANLKSLRVPLKIGFGNTRYRNIFLLNWLCYPWNNAIISSSLFNNILLICIIKYSKGPWKFSIFTPDIWGLKINTLTKKKCLIGLVLVVLCCLLEGCPWPVPVVSEYLAHFHSYCKPPTCEHQVFFCSEDSRTTMPLLMSWRGSDSDGTRLIDPLSVSYMCLETPARTVGYNLV